MMNKLSADQEDRGLELFSTLVEMATEFGNLTVIEAMQQVLKMEVEQDGCCTTCQRKAEWWNRELSQLLCRYHREFPEISAVARINSLGPRGGLIQ
jgi:hypothetical protein